MTDKTPPPTSSSKEEKEIDAHIDQTLSDLHHAICAFLHFATPADLLDEIANHFREHYESDDDDMTAAIPLDDSKLRN